MRVPLISVAVVALIAAGLAGCGGDTRRAESEGGQSTETKPAASAPAANPAPTGTVRVAKIADPVRRAYVARVDAVCGKVDPERSKEQERAGAQAGSPDAVRAYDDTIALGWKQLRQIEAIPEPPGELPLLKANVFDAIRSQLAIRRKIAEAFAAVEVPRLRRLRAELDNSTRTLTGFARGYGFQVCGEE